MNNVGPAFSDMTLRQYYAAHAPPMTDRYREDSKADRMYLTALAYWRFEYADAMLKAEGYHS